MSDLTPEKEAELRAAVKLKDSQPGVLCEVCVGLWGRTFHPANRPHGTFPRTSE